ncbi:MAG: hypothetical protein VYA48_02795, partial [Gemmatimonadota bacterium]|nr:hypothetical protein [Gemmatimonadota bacterium]
MEDMVNGRERDVFVAAAITADEVPAEQLVIVPAFWRTRSNSAGNLPGEHIRPGIDHVVIIGDFSTG